MSEGKVSQWFRQFKDGQTNVRDEDRRGRLYVANDDLVEKAKNKNCENWQFPISKLSTFFSTYFTYTTLWNCVREAALPKSLCKMGAQNANGKTQKAEQDMTLNPLKPELNSICYLLALLAHHFLHVCRIRVKSLNFRRLMSYTYIFGAPILDVSRSHTTTQHSR